jgi:hypothetical protein
MTTASPMTSQPEVAAAVVAAGVYEATAHGDDGLELVVVRVHGGPWLVYLDPESTCGWVAYRAEATEGGWLVHDPRDRRHPWRRRPGA